MKRTTKLMLFGAIAVGVLVVLFINLSVPRQDSYVSELQKPNPAMHTDDGMGR